MPAIRASGIRLHAGPTFSILLLSLLVGALALLFSFFLSFVLTMTSSNNNKARANRSQFPMAYLVIFLHSPHQPKNRPFLDPLIQESSYVFSSFKVPYLI